MIVSLSRDLALKNFNLAFFQGGGGGGVYLRASETDRKLTEDALRASEERRKLGAAVAGLALAEINYECDSTDLSAEAARLFGLGETSVVLPRSAIHATFHPDDHAELMAAIAKSLDPNGLGWFAMEHRIVLPDNTIRWLRVRKQVFFAGEGAGRRPSHAMLAALDVTREMAALESVRRKEEFVLGVLDSLPQQIAVMDTAGTLIAVNEAWRRFARENGGEPLASLGANYLEICHAAATEGDAVRETSP